MSSIITFPSDSRIAFKNADFGLRRRTIVLRSPYTGKRQSIVQPYALWGMTGNFATVDGAAAGLLRAFLVQLQGQANKFRLPVPGVSGTIGNYVGTQGSVNGGAQTGTSLVTNGWSISSSVFSPGDYFTVNDELKVVTASAASDGSGNLTVNFVPPLRASPPNATNLLFNAPTVMMSANTDDAATWKLSAPVLHDIPIDFIEAVE